MASTKDTQADGLGRRQKQVESRFSDRRGWTVSDTIPDRSNPHIAWVFVRWSDGAEYRVPTDDLRFLGEVV